MIKSPPSHAPDPDERPAHPHAPTYLGTLEMHMMPDGEIMLTVADHPTLAISHAKTLGDGTTPMNIVATWIERGARNFTQAWAFTRVRLRR